MNNLAISVIKLHDALTLNRLDAEYYEPSHLQLNNVLTSKRTVPISSFATVTDGIHESIKFDEASKINLFSAMSPKENYFDISKNKSISETQHKANPRTALKVDDVIVSTVGTIGNCAVVDETLLPANSDRHVGIIRIHKDISPQYLSTFLLTKYGRFQTLRESTGNVQLNLFIEKLLTIQVPTASDEFQSKITKLVTSANQNRIEATSLYKVAESQLLISTGLDSFKPSIRNVSTRVFSDFSNTERLDAEYWNPDFDDIEDLIQASPDGYTTIQEAFTISDEIIGDDPNKEYKYIQLADVNPLLGMVESNTEILGVDLPSRAKMQVRNRDILLSSVEGSINKIALVHDASSNLVGSTGFIVLRELEFAPEVALTLLKSLPIQQLLKRQAQGTILTAVPKTNLHRVYLPKVNEGIQKQIISSVQSVHKKIAESKALLAKAKNAVEIFIEQGEGPATKYINNLSGDN